jgi:teichuronic acid biosynthesis glycosyltransferase TuaC
MGNILFFNQSRDIGGTDTFLLTLVRNWPDKNDNLYIWCNRGHRGRELYKDLGVNYGETGFPTLEEIYLHIEGWPVPSVIKTALKRLAYLLTPLLFVSSILYFVPKLKRAGITAIYSSNGGYPAGQLNLALVIAGRLAAIKHDFLIIHGAAAPRGGPFSWWDKLIDHWVASSCTEIISVSRACAEQIEKARLKNSKLRVIYNGIEQRSFGRPVAGDKRKVLGIGKDAIVVGYIGHYEEGKGLEYLLEAFAEIKQRRPDSKLVLIGNDSFPYAAKLKAAILSLGLQDSVCLRGYLDDAREYIASFDLLVLPSSSFESFGLVLLEGMFYGKPVIGTAIGGIPEVIGDAGIIVEAKSAGALAEKMLYLLNDPEAAQNYVRKGLARLKLFTAEKMAGEYQGLLGGESVIGQPGSPAVRMEK